MLFHELLTLELKGWEIDTIFDNKYCTEGHGFVIEAKREKRRKTIYLCATDLGWWVDTVKVWDENDTLTIHHFDSCGEVKTLNVERQFNP